MFMPGVKLNNFSARFESVYTPKESGEVSLLSLLMTVPVCSLTEKKCTQTGMTDLRKSKCIA